jgi:hypothetical protein
MTHGKIGRRTSNKENFLWLTFLVISFPSKEPYYNAFFISCTNNLCMWLENLDLIRVHREEKTDITNGNGEKYKRRAHILT